MPAKRKIPDEIRQICNLRDGNSCQFPGCSLSKLNGDQMNLHHIINEQFGGTEDPSNLITLCDIHHKAMHVEFHAFYPDSLGVLNHMNHILWKTVSKIRSVARVDDAYDLKPYLYYLTRSKEFNHGQLEAIRASMKGQDVLFVSPTGSGKSVCYQLPGMISSSPTLVVSPLKSLMVDQVRSIWSKMIPATYINSDLGEVEIKKRYEFIGKKLYKFIFAAPERFFSSKDSSVNQLYANYSYLVIDEAHAIDSWGIAFRPSYRKLGELRRRINNPPLIALTATASRDTQQNILTSLGIPDAKVIVTGFYRNNIKIFKHTAKSKAGKYEFLIGILAKLPDEKTIIFVPTIKEGNELTEKLKTAGNSVEFYNGQLDTKEKMDIQSRFTSVSKPNLYVLISTTAFGMGIDIPDIRKVIHWAPALSITEYTQQIGRAGRDGQQARAYLLYEPDDESLLRYLATRSTKKADFKDKHDYTDSDVIKVEGKLNKQVDDMISLVTIPDGNEWNHIRNYFGESPLLFWIKFGQIIVDSVIVICFILILIYVINIIIS